MIGANEAEDARFLCTSNVGGAITRHSAVGCRLHRGRDSRLHGHLRRLKKRSKAISTKTDDGKLGLDEGKRARSRAECAKATVVMATEAPYLR